MDCLLSVVLISYGSSGVVRVHHDLIVVVGGISIPSVVVCSGSSQVLGRSINVVHGIHIVVSTASPHESVGPVSFIIGLDVNTDILVELDSFG